MQKTTVTYYCDRCGKKHDVKVMTQINFMVIEGTNTISKPVDICKACLTILCQKMISAIPLEAQTEMVQSLSKL